MFTSSDILKARILIVDDLARNVLLLEQMLDGAGYTSLTSTKNPHEACVLHQKNHYDLILLDIQMPGMDGFQVLEGLKKLDVGGDVPVIALTAQPDHKLRALKAGAKDFISQPFDLAEVLMRVHNLLEVRLLHRDETLLNYARLENAQRIARLGDWEHDFAHNRQFWSDEVYRILGITRESSPPDLDTFYRRVHPDDLAFVQGERKAAAESSRSTGFEHRIIRADGEVRYVHQIIETSLDDQGRLVRESGTLQDITARTLAARTLAQSEERYRKLLMLSPDANFVQVDGLITLVNDSFCALMGASGPDEFLGRSALEIAHPDDRQLVQKRLRMLLDEQLMHPAEMKFIRLDGSAVDVEVTSVAFEFHGCKEVQVIARDITRRRRADEELREKKAFLEAQVDASIDGILVVDTKGRKILQNQRFLELVKMPQIFAEEPDDQKSFEFVGSLMRHEKAFLEKVVHLYANPAETSRDELELKDGTVLDRYSSPVLGKEGKNYGRIWTFRDITARKAAEVALRGSEERFKLVARAVSDVIWDWDLVTDEVWWSDGFQTTFGYGASEVGPGIDSWTGRIHPDERRRVVEGIHHAIKIGAESWHAEYPFQRKDGTYAFVQDRGYILRDAEGKGMRMVGGIRDLTEQKKMEAQYLRAQRMESIGTLAGGIAHDLNNVLTPIMMAIELLQLEPGQDPQHDKILGTIQISCQRGADLVKQVLSFARGLDGQRIAIRLRHLTDDLEAMISETFPRNIQIVTDVPGNIWPITGDPTQLHQVMLNLVVNARDSMPQGGLLTLALSNVMIDARNATMRPEARQGAYVLLQVTDTGLGISPKIRERIFEPFFTTKEPGKGTGIGLATVHTIVKSHGGFLNVESEEGKGTTFKIYLPADPANQTTATVHPFEIGPPHGRSELVLVIDDEDSIRDITRRTLEAFGYRVITARDGAEGISLYSHQSREIALVITDMMMPVMEGQEAIQVIARINPAARIIAASGLEASENIAKAITAGVHDFLPKPYTSQTLLRLVREVLDRPSSHFAA